MCVLSDGTLIWGAYLNKSKAKYLLTLNNHIGDLRKDCRSLKTIESNTPTYCARAPPENYNFAHKKTFIYTQKTFKEQKRQSWYLHYAHYAHDACTCTVHNVMHFNLYMY